MMMKNINISKIILVLMLFMLTGCEKYLETKIYNQATVDNFPKTESDVINALIPFYSQFKPDWGATDISSKNRGVYDFSFTVAYLGYTWATSTQSDESFDEYYSAYGQFTLGSSSHLNSSGQSFYDRVSYVGKLTLLIDNIEKSSFNKKDQLAGEAKAMRAWFMFIMYDLYGPVSIKLDPADNLTNDFVPRMSNTDYVNAMVSDLNSAIAVLPSMYNNTGNWGRISTGVARMILLKIYMHEKDWADAKKVGMDLMGMGYNVNTPYKNVFTTPQNLDVIYAVPGNSAQYNWWYPSVLPEDAKTVLGIDVSEGQKWRLVHMPWDFYDKYQPGDLRLQTIASSYVTNKGVTIGRENPQKMPGAIPVKYTNYVKNTLSFDLVIYRYADVLLSMAEIENELNNGPTTNAIGYTKQITDRANTTIPASATASYAAFKQFLLDERGRELYDEFGIRRQDLIRNGSFISNAISRGITWARNYMVLWPIPSDVIDQSFVNGEPVVKQNDGY